MIRQCVANLAGTTLTRAGYASASTSGGRYSHSSQRCVLNTRSGTCVSVNANYCNARREFATHLPQYIFDSIALPQYMD